MSSDHAAFDLKVLLHSEADRRQFGWEVRDEAGEVVEAGRHTYARRAEAVRAGHAALECIQRGSRARRGAGHTRKDATPPAA